MFHRATGATFFFIVSIMFFLLSLQNTWAFLNRVLPDADQVFIVCMMVIFEGGFVGWLAMLMGGAQNVWRMLIAFVMMLITGTGVFIGAWYEIGGMMHKGIGYKIDPTILSNVPTAVIFAYIATGIAIVLYMLASPEFFARVSHMNQHGTAPVNMRVYPVRVSPATNNPKALPAPASARSTTEPLPIPQSVDLLQRAGSFIGGLFGRRKGIEVDTSDATPEAEADDISESSVDEVEEVAEVQYNVAPQSRQPRARTRPSSNAARARRSPAQIDRILSALDKAEPGQSDASLARAAGCSTSTVSRWRKQ